MSVKVCKFGGTSMADGNVIKSVKRIIESDAERRYIVVSAPGKRYSGDNKVTDLLCECHRKLLENGNAKEGFAPVRARFRSIAKELGIGPQTEALLDETERLIEENASEDFTLSRGEYLSASIAAVVFGAKFIDAADVIFFGNGGGVDGEKTYKALAKACSENRFAVFAGFYGSDAEGRVKTFSRGGSDITGALIARAIRASVYENWTDVSGFYACDPRIVASPRHIKSLSYEEMGELSFMGAGVLHSQSVSPVREANIPIVIKNTFRPQDEGTYVLPATRFFPGSGPVTGVSGKKGYSLIIAEKDMAGADGGFLRRVTDILNECGVKAELFSACADCLSFAVPQSGTQAAEEALSRIKKALSPLSVQTVKNVALVAAVGRGLNSSPGTAARIFAALSQEGINVKFISFGASSITLAVGVDEKDFENCIKALYREFFN